jgi:hypothetical protein
MFSAMLAIAAFAVAISTLPALARPMASSARTCHNHAGTFEGDGEYSDGAVQEASGISCARALALVKTRYHWIYAHWNQAYHHGFRIRSFSCHMKPEGPDDLKICRDGHRRFDFV